jgi:hypothetical protein
MVQAVRERFLQVEREGTHPVKGFMDDDTFTGFPEFLRQA